MRLCTVRQPGSAGVLALACDLVIAADTAKFIQAFRNVGLVPDGGAIYFLSQIVGAQQAREIVYSARPVTATEALGLGLVSKVVPEAQLRDAARRLAITFVRGPAFSFGVAKKLFKSMAVPSLEAFLDAEAWAQEACFLTADHREGVAAFLEKRPANFGAGGSVINKDQKGANNTMMNGLDRTESPSQGVVNAAARLDRLPISGFHWRLLGLIGAGLFLDGFEIYLAGGVIGLLVKTGWTSLESSAQFISAGVVGMMLGAWLSGILGDRYGRRFSYQLNLLIFGLASFASAAAPSMPFLVAARFVMGIGLGAEIVVGYATLVEYIPPSYRGRWGAGLSFFTILPSSRPRSAAISFCRRSVGAGCSSASVLRP